MGLPAASLDSNQHSGMGGGIGTRILGGGSCVGDSILGAGDACLRSSCVGDSTLILGAGDSNRRRSCVDADARLKPVIGEANCVEEARLKPIMGEASCSFSARAAASWARRLTEASCNSLRLWLSTMRVEGPAGAQRGAARR